MNKKSFTKLTVMAIIAVFTFAAIPQNTFAQTDKQNAKIEKLEQKTAYNNAKTEAKKSATNFKDKVNELEKDGWKIAGDYRTLELAMIEHQNKMDANPMKYRTVTGTVQKCRSESMGKSQARFNAQKELLFELTAKMVGEEGNANSNNENVGSGVANFIQVAQSTAKGNMGGVLIPSYSIVKQNSDGTMTYQTIFFVDRDKEEQVGEDAMEKAIKETDMVIEQANTIRQHFKQALQNDVDSADSDSDD